MSGTEVDTAADQSEMEAQSAAAEEMSQRALDIARKVFSAFQLSSAGAGKGSGARKAE